MMKKVVFLLLFPLFAEAVVSCCNCMETTSYWYSNKTLSVSNLDGSGHEAIVSSSDTILKKAYGIRVDLVREQVVCTPKWQGFFISSAYAYSCSCGSAKEFLPRDSITAIRIFTNYAFDNDHPAGSDVSDRFKVFYSHAFYTIEDYLGSASLLFYDEREFTFTRDFLLMTPPTLGNDHRFKVQYTLSDGRVLEKETLPVKLI